MFDDIKVDKESIEKFPSSPIILAVCSPYQQKIGNNLILQLLLEHNIEFIDMSDSKGIIVIINTV